MTTQCLLLGPGGSSAQVMLPDDVALNTLRSTIAKALGLPARNELVLRRSNATLLDQTATLAASGVRTGDWILVESSARQRFGRGGRRAESGTEVIPSAYRVLPCYLVVDTSASMAGEPIGKINEEVPELRKRMMRKPLLAEVCQLSLVTFDVSATVHVKLTDVSKMEFTPLEAIGRQTNYVKPFELLRNTIAGDLYDLLLLGRRPYRPVVFFLSDGQHNVPDGDWRGPLGEFTDRHKFHGAPNVIAFGFGDATEENIKAVGRKAAYMPEEGGPAAKLDTFMAFLLSSLIASISRAPKDEDDVLVVPPTPPAGWRPIRIVR